MPRFDNYREADARSNLLDLFRQKKPVLFAGAGFSKLAGYPLWRELIRDLAAAFNLTYLDSEPLDAVAKRIKAAALEQGRIQEYQNQLHDIFKDNLAGRGIQPIHQSLVKLGFSGFVTTNYDNMLELAINRGLGDAANRYQCEHVNLCDRESVLEVFDCLRGIASDVTTKYVLHLHGHFRKSKSIILTEDEYLAAYKRRRTEGGPAQNDEIGFLDSIHRKVLWTLLVMRPQLFVGFSVTDPFILDMIDLVINDFGLANRLSHYAIMDFHDEATKRDVGEKLLARGIQPIFYQVPTENRGDHSGLNNLVAELLGELGEEAAESQDVNTLAIELLERGTDADQP